MNNTEITENPLLLFSVAKHNVPFKVMGCCYSDDASQLPRENIVNTSAIEPRSSRSLSLSERIEHVLANSGWFHYSNGVRINIIEKKIAKFALFPPFIDRLAVESESDIVNLFGPPTKVDELASLGDLMKKTYVYQANAMQVYWDVWDAKLTHINF